MAHFGSRSEIKKIMGSRRNELLSKANVVGMAVGKKDRDHDDYALVVFVEKKKSLQSLSPLDIIPQEIDGVITDVVESGEISKLIRARHRPVFAGISIGHVNVTAGTFGSVVYDKDTNEPLILSNNHVLADSNAARIGDPIIQPGSFDGGLSSDVVAYLDKFVPIKFPQEISDCPVGNGAAGLLNGIASLLGRKTRLQPVAEQEPENLVDAAIGKPLTTSILENRIINIGTPVGSAQVDIGDIVVKSGRTTGTTTGEVLYLDAEVRVYFGDQGTALFTNQIIMSDMSDGGDSGSVIVKMIGGQPYVVGLLFAGSADFTIANEISNVTDLLNIKFTDDA